MYITSNTLRVLPVCCRRAKTGPRDEHTVAVSRQPTRGVGHQNVATSERLIATLICLLFASSNRYLSNDFRPCCRFSGDTSIVPTCVFLVTWINFVDCLLQGRLGRRLRSSSSGRSAGSSLYSQQADVSSFWCHRLERPASPRRICTVTRGFQTMTQDLSVFPFLPRHYHMTVYYYHHSSLLSGHLWCLQ